LQLRKDIDEFGFSVIGEALRTGEVANLADALLAVPRRARQGGARNPEKLAAVRELARHPSIKDAVKEILGSGPFMFKATLFDKGPDANWSVGWHQDVVIPVREHRNCTGWSAWSLKAGVIHVQPPAAILEHVLAVRVQLDAATSFNGPLCVLPGSHRTGKLSGAEIAIWHSRIAARECLSASGGLIILRPLLVHSSPRSKAAFQRRVIHLEFSARTLPFPMQWPEHCIDCGT